MAGIKISELDTGVPLATDETPATDTQDTTSSPTGTTKKYIRSDVLNWILSALGGDVVAPVRVATTAALTATYSNGASGVGATLTNSGAMAALTIDGVALALNDRVLVKNQASTFQNGIYIVTTVGSGAINWVLTRALDYNQPAEIIQYQFITVNEGTTNQNTTFQETGAGPFTIGTTPITFAASSALAGAYVISITGTANQVIVSSPAGDVVLSLPQDIASTSSPTFNGLTLTNALTVANGGTGLNTLPTTATASIFAAWNAQANLPMNNLLPGFTTTATAAGNTTLVVGSTYYQFFTGTTTQTVTMPVTSTLALGQSWYIVNNSTGVVTINSSGGNVISALAPDTSALITCQLTSGTTAASWNTSYGEIISPVVVAQGGTGRTSSTAFALIAGGTTATGAQQSVNAGSNGQLLQSKGNAALPDFTTATYPSTVTANNILYASGSNVVGQLTPGTSVLSALQLAIVGSSSRGFPTSEEGTWTPVITCATPGNLSVAYGTQTGFYQVIGNRCYFQMSLIATPTYTSASGAITITGFPFSSNGSNYFSSMTVGGASFSVPANSVSYYMSATAVAATQNPRYTVSTAGTTQPLNITVFPTTTAAILFCNGSYHI